MLKKLFENKALKIIGNILYYALVVFVLLILGASLLQRLSNNNKSIAGFRIFNIVTESMVPKYKVGDILLSKEVEPSEIKVGDDVVYLGAEGSFSGKTVTHQVIQIEKNEDGTYTFHTKGIANEIEDPVIKDSQVYGVIVYKTHILSSISKIVNNLTAFYFCIFMPLAILIIVKIIKIFREGKNNDDDDEDEEDESEEEKVSSKDKKEEGK